MVKLLAAVVMSSALLMGAPQDGGDPGQSSGKKVHVIYKSIETIDMDGAEMMSELNSPRIKWITSRRGQHFDAQIQERDHFKAELLGSLEKI